MTEENPEPFDAVQRLIRLKRHEMPDEQFPERVVEQFWERQRRASLGLSVRALFRERLALWWEDRFGGRGDFLGAATSIVWLNAATIAIQILQLVALVLAPPIAGIIAIATLAWLLWAFSCFVAELHGFASPAVVLGVVVLTGIVLVFALTFLAALAGFAPQGAP